MGYIIIIIISINSEAVKYPWPVVFTYQIGEIMVHLTGEEAQKHLQKQQEQVTVELQELYSNIQSIQKVMSDLKVQLYAKFGENINLEAD